MSSAAVRRYQKSEKGRAKRRQREQTPEFKAKKAAYDNSPEVKARRQARQKTEKYKAADRKRNKHPDRRAAKLVWQRRYGRSEKGKAKKRAYIRRPDVRARIYSAFARRRTLQYGDPCICCTAVDLRHVYERARLLGREVDHREPVALGGKHCRSNLQLLTYDQHKKKTALDLLAIKKRRSSAHF